MGGSPGTRWRTICPGCSGPRPTPATAGHGASGSAVCGYVQLRSAENVRFAEEQRRLLEERLRFVRQLYQDAMEDKRSLRRQILGRRDSFGKVYAVTRALNETPPDKLPAKTVELLEDVLQNHSAAFYFVDAAGRTAKRAACSEGAEAPRFLEGPALAALVQTLEQEEVWVNRTMTPGLPMFGAAVRVDGKLRALVLLYDAGGEQLSLHYQNLFRILCGLVETAMTRAAQPLPEKRPRRKLILSVLTDDPVQYYDLLEQARLNDDSEVVHYAATAMAQISKQADAALQRHAARFTADQPKEEQYGLGCRLAKVQLELAEYAAAEQTLAETPFLP